MTEIAKCRCGAAARLSPPWSGRIRAVCVNDECDIRGPRALSEVEAIAAWNALMRPRPVAEWTEATDSAALWCGELCLGRVRLVDGRGWTALCCVTGDRPSGHALLRTEDSARAWLEERVKAAGFEAREESSRA